MADEVSFFDSTRVSCSQHSAVKRHPGDVWKYLHEGLPSGTVYFGAHVERVEQPASRSPRLLVDGKRLEFDLIVGADGGRSVVRPVSPHPIIAA